MSFFNCNLTGSAGGSGGAVVEELAPVLLWENPDPTSVFENQKIELNLTDYAGVIIEYYLDTNNQIIANRLYVKKDDTFTTNDNRNNFGAGYEGSSIVTRALNSVTDSYVWFRNGLLGDGTQTINNGVIPYRIYGVKEYIVEVVTSTPAPELTEGNICYNNCTSGTEFGNTQSLTYEYRAIRDGVCVVTGSGLGNGGGTLTVTGDGSEELLTEKNTKNSVMAAYTRVYKVKTGTTLNCVMSSAGVSASYNGAALQVVEF